MSESHAPELTQREIFEVTLMNDYGVSIDDLRACMRDLVVLMATNGIPSISAHVTREGVASVSIPAKEVFGSGPSPQPSPQGGEGETSGGAQ